MSSFPSPRKRRIILKILSYISTASLLLMFVILPVQPIAHADIVDLDDMGAAGMITGYGMWNGTSLAYELWDDLSYTGQAAGQLVEGLWNQAYVELGTLPTYSSLGEYYSSGVISQYQVYGSPYSQIIITEEMANTLDLFWDWLLRREGFSRDPSTGLFELPLENSRNQVFEANEITVEGIQFYKLPFSNGTSDPSSAYEWSINSLGSASYLYGALNWQSGWRNGTYLFVSDGSSASVKRTFIYNNQAQPNPSVTQLSSVSSEGIYYANITTQVSSTSIPAQSFVISDVISSISSLPEPDSLDLVVVANRPILIPDPSDPDYEPQPVSIPTLIPYPPEYAPLPVPVPDPVTGDFPEDAPLPEDVADALAEPLVQGAIDGELVAENPELNPDPEPGPAPDAPVEVVTPVLPFTLPSFNFSLSGIWHYVVEWVGTLGSWFSMVFTIWSHLPYAIVVPVYASAVVVIVLGVYKRFFM